MHIKTSQETCYKLWAETRLLKPFTSFNLDLHIKSLNTISLVGIYCCFTSYNNIEMKPHRYNSKKIPSHIRNYILDSKMKQIFCILIPQLPIFSEIVLLSMDYHNKGVVQVTYTMDNS